MIMKKTVYMAPAIKVAQSESEEFVCTSIFGVTGDAGIWMGEGDAPATADSRVNVWGEDEYEE